MIEILMFLAVSLASSGDRSANTEISKLSAALRCAKIEDRDLLSNHFGPKYMVSFVEDRLSYTDYTNFILIIFPKKGSIKVFDFREEVRSANINLNLQNSGSFYVRGRSIIFDAPPLGGVWRQNHLVSSIKKAIKSSRYNLTRNSVASMKDNFTCSSYVNPRH